MFLLTDIWDVRGSGRLQPHQWKQGQFCPQGGAVCGGPGLISPWQLAGEDQTHEDQPCETRLGVSSLSGEEEKSRTFSYSLFCCFLFWLIHRQTDIVLFFFLPSNFKDFFNKWIIPIGDVPSSKNTSGWSWWNWFNSRRVQESFEVCLCVMWIFLKF